MTNNTTPGITRDTTSIIGNGDNTGSTTPKNSSGMILWIDSSKNIIPIYEESGKESLLESEELKLVIKNVNEESISQKVNKSGDTMTGNLILQQKNDDEQSLYPELSIRNKNAEILFGIKYEGDGCVDGTEHTSIGNTQPPEEKITISLGDCPVILSRSLDTPDPANPTFYLFDSNNDTRLKKVYANYGFVGDLEGNASTADTAANDSSGANIDTRFSNLEARPTIYSSTSTPSSSSGKNGDLWVVYT